VKQKNAVQTAKLKLDAEGLPAGTYTVDGTDAAGSVARLAEFTIAASTEPAEGTEPTTVPADDTEENEVDVTIPSTVDARAIVSISVTDANGTVVLTGAEGEVVKAHVRYFANVAVTAPVATEPVAATEGQRTKRVRGHVVVQSVVRTEDGETIEKKRFLLWVGFGAPGSTELTISVDGVEAGTVTSTKQGKVKFKGLAAGIVLADVQNISLINPATGLVVMEANF
jgi:hypothetical protein